MRIEEDIQILGNVSVNFRKTSSEIFQIYIDSNEIERQKNSPHLGIISQAYKNINHSRYDYLILQCVISEIIENSFKGTTSAQGQLSFAESKIEGNDLIKSWILLSNFGHCKNTIGDEKTILTKIIQDKKFKSEFLALVKDKDFKNLAKEIISDFDYTKFHHIITVIRLFEILKGKKKLRDEILSIYKLLLCKRNIVKNQPQLDLLINIYNVIRNISIISIDYKNSSLPINLDILSTILSINRYEDRFNNKSINHFFTPFLETLHNKLYISEKTQKFQRQYEINALDNIVDIQIDDIINNAINEGLGDANNIHLNHFSRFEIPISNKHNIKLSEYVSYAMSVKEDLDFIETSVDINPLSKILYHDFYLHNNFELKHFPRFLSNIENLILNHSLDDLSVEDLKFKHYLKEITTICNSFSVEENISSEIINQIEKYNIIYNSKHIVQNNFYKFKNILWSTLRYFIDIKYHFDIDYNLNYDSFAISHKFINNIKVNFEDAISKEIETSRIHELNQLYKSAKRNFSGTTLCCLNRIKIYDYSKAPDKRIITDIDGLILKYSQNEFIIELHEAKNTKNPTKDAVKDLNTNLIKVLNQNAKGYKIVKVEKFGAKIYIKSNIV